MKEFIDSYSVLDYLPQLTAVSETEGGRYMSLVSQITHNSQFLQAPDLLIYLKADVSTLVTQIHKRGRAYEDSIRLSYLENLNEKYEKWISNYKDGKLLIVDVNTIKFAEKPEDFGEIINKIDAELFGLF